jgi:hypothetical protein
VAQCVSNQFAPADAATVRQSGGCLTKRQWEEDCGADGRFIVTAAIARATARWMPRPSEISSALITVPMCCPKIPIIIGSATRAWENEVTAPEVTAPERGEVATEATTEESAAPEQPAAPAGPEPTFEDGTHRVGTDIAPGTYVALDPGPGCYWARLSGFGGSFDEIIANDSGSGQAIVTVAESDAGFETRCCGEWIPVDQAPARDAMVPFGDGTWCVGPDIAAGTWTSPGDPGCYWARLSGLGGTFDEIITNDLQQGSAIVTIAESDAGFRTRGCGEWTPS